MSDKKVSVSKKDKKMNPTTLLFLKTQVLMLVINAIFALSASFAFYVFQVNQNLYFYFSVIIFGLTSFIGGYYSGYHLHKNGLVIGLIFCLPMNVLLILISFALNHFKFDLTSVISLFLLLIASMLGGVLSVNTRLKAKQNNRKGRKQ